MDEDIDRLVVRVRADTAGFARDLVEMRGEIDGPLQKSAERAGRGVEAALLRAVRSGKLGFEELKAVAASALASLAASALRGGLASIFGGASRDGGSDVSAVLAGLLGAPGRATGGPVAPGRAYRVGEHGPELFVPTASGRIETGAGGGTREVRVAITVNASAGEAPAALRQSSRQVARAVRAALSEEN